MNPDIWKRLQDIFEQGKDLEGDALEQYLNAVCSNDTNLLNEAKALIQSAKKEDVSLSQFLTTGANEFFTQSTTPYPEDYWISKILGPWQIIEHIADGGMGGVFKAKRADGMYDQTLALKIVKAGAISENILQRFNLERQILGKLTHPNIAGLVDGGITDEGLPFLVMEYVEGLPITSYCDNNNLSIGERILLFKKVCDAVHYAHQNLVIHRDLKPANILVNGQGEVKLLDFGIAKLLDDDLDPGLTQTHVALFTPAYAAPEQFLNSSAATTAVDIYALGVILYELLCGQKPFVASRTPEEYKEHVLAGDPAKPSTAVTRILFQDNPAKVETTAQEISSFRKTAPNTLRRLLQGDLDTICLMALRVEPSHRYLSAEQMGSDLERHLKQQPIIARPDSLAYRVNRFFVRNRSAAIASFIAMAVFLGTTAFYTQQVAKQRDAALLEQERTKEVVKFVTDLFYVSDPLEGGGRGDVTAREILDEGSRRINEELTERPRIHAELSRVLGNVYYGLDMKEVAHDHLQTALTQQQDLFGEFAPETVPTYRVLGFIHQDKGEYQDARHYFEASLNGATKEYGEFHNEVQETLSALAFLDETEGNFDAAETTYQRALIIAESLPDNVERQAKVLSDLAGLYRQRDRWPEAEEILLRALTLQEDYYQDEHIYVLDTKRKLAGLYRDTDRFDESETLYKEVIEARTRILGPDHHEVRNTWNSYAQLLSAMGDNEGALIALSTAIDSIERTRTGPNVSLAAMYHNRAYFQKELGRQEEAIKDFDRSIAMQDEVGLEPDHPNRAFPLGEKADVLTYLGRPDEAKAILLDVLEIRKKHYPDDHRLMLETYNELGMALMHLSEYVEAEEYLMASFEGFRNRNGIDHRTAQLAIEHLIELYERSEQPEKINEYQALLVSQ